MNPITSPVRWTINDLDALPENEEIYREIIAGELFVTRAPHWKHQHIITNISAILHDWSKRHGGFVIASPGIISSQVDSVIPDLIWVSDQRLKKIEDQGGHFTGFPELVIEVLSAGEQNIYRDKQAKLKLYSQGSVQEYWIVDRFNQQLEVYRQERGQLMFFKTLKETDQLTSPLLPEFCLSVSEIFSQ
ncbi:Uma2 family endonuclease [Euhalothece natronophila Z-M001]|uniref:Uma2 family endonuclease n=1 Tax=Euhalothece natronophila Z-M001 TaxID=522448 RepID=A0A5B8NQW5_9CHRO|nr:Uma2 family endonuclease [Euhalothece natronophila]QDZ41357.1 Uma2 family endonuclease [Euhalothece natronophila Z-M001]